MALDRASSGPLTPLEQGALRMGNVAGEPLANDGGQRARSRSAAGASSRAKIDEKKRRSCVWQLVFCLLANQVGEAD